MSRRQGLALIAGAVFVMPLLFLILGSLRGPAAAPPAGLELLPAEPTLDSFSRAFGGAAHRPDRVVGGFRMTLLGRRARRIIVGGSLIVLMIPLSLPRTGRGRQGLRGRRGRAGPHPGGRGGRLVTLLGPSGSGKSTSLRIVAGLERADEGSVRIGGLDVGGVQAADRGVSMVFQRFALFPHMTVAENIGFGLLARKPPGEAAPGRGRRRVAGARAAARPPPGEAVGRRASAGRARSFAAAVARRPPRSEERCAADVTRHQPSQLPTCSEIRPADRPRLRAPLHGHRPTRSRA